MKRILVFCIGALFNIILISAQAPDSLIKVTEGVYILDGHIGNIAILITDEGAVVIDAGDKPEAGKRILDRVKELTSKPIRQVILTHYHFDHVGGVSALPSNVSILAHLNTKINIQNREVENKKMLEINQLKLDSLKEEFSKLKKPATDSLIKSTQKTLDELSKNKFALPTETMKDEFQFVSGNDTIFVKYKDKGHTDGDITIWFKNRDVLVLGDLLFNNSFPYIDPIGNTSTWAKQLREYASANMKYYIPGHGYAASANDLIILAKYLEDLESEVSKFIAEGKSLDEMKKSIVIPETANFNFQFFREQNIEAVYQQLKNK